MESGLPKEDQSWSRKENSPWLEINLVVKPTTAELSVTSELSHHAKIRSVMSKDFNVNSTDSKWWPNWSRRRNKTINKLRRMETKLREDKPETCWSWVESTWMNLLFGVVIFLNSMCIGFDLLISDADGRSPFFMVVVESIFLGFFWVELILRLLAHSMKQFCLDPWGPFDFGVTLLGSLDTWVLTPIFGGSKLPSGFTIFRILRLLRLARLLRLFKKFKQLTVLVKQVANALRALGWVSVLLFLGVYVCVIITLMLINCDQDSSLEIQRICQGIGWAFFYHLMVVTGEGYLDFLVEPTVALNLWWYVYWIFVIGMLNFVMVSAVIGVITEMVLREKAEENDEMLKFVYEAEAFRKALLTVFETSDADHNGVLDADELVSLLQSQKMMSVMAAFGVTTDLPVETLLVILGLQREKSISFKQFYQSCVRVCGASRNIRALMLKYEVQSTKQKVAEHISRIRSIQDSLANTGGASSESNARAIPSVTSFTAIAGSMPACVCSASRVGFSAAFSTKIQLAKKRLSILEHRQEEILFRLCEVRNALFASSDAVRCPKGHLLMPLGTGIHRVGKAEYWQWNCDVTRKGGRCSNGQAAGVHLAHWRRYHCAHCRYDMCELCYQSRLSKLRSRSSKLRSPALSQFSWLPPPPLPSSQWWETSVEHAAKTQPTMMVSARRPGD